MAQADPENAMGWFSLGNAYKDADRLSEAADALYKAVEKDETYSRAYQLLGEVLVSLDKNEEATKLLTKGFTVAASKGDRMPQKAMGSILEKIGAPVPVIVEEKKEAIVLTGEQIICKRTNQPGTKMAELPMKGPVGQYIFENYCQETWREWIGQGTKVINELRLDFSNEEHQVTFEQQMLEWLGVTKQDILDASA